MQRDFLFDIGNVILKFDFEAAHRQLLPIECRASSESLHALQRAQAELESGRLDDENFISRAMEITGFSGSPAEFTRIWCEIFEPNTAVCDLVAQLASRGHRLFLLSNTSGLHAEYFEREYPVFDCFQDAVYSHTAKSLKPDRKIFEEAVRQFDLDPGATVYIDDRDENVAAGRRLGLHAILYDYDRHEDLLDALQALGVDLEPR